MSACGHRCVSQPLVSWNTVLLVSGRRDPQRQCPKEVHCGAARLANTRFTFCVRQFVRKLPGHLLCGCGGTHILQIQALWRERWEDLRIRGSLDHVQTLSQKEQQKTNKISTGKKRRGETQLCVAPVTWQPALLEDEVVLSGVSWHCRQHLPLCGGPPGAQGGTVWAGESRRPELISCRGTHSD